MGQLTWSWLIVIYLFLGGLGAGAFLTAATFELSGWRDKRKFCPTSFTGAMISGPAVLLGCILLILDLGMGKTEPWRIIYLFTNFESVMTWGIWILVFFIPIAFLYGFLEFVDADPFVQGLLSSRLPRITPFLKGLLWNRLPNMASKAGRWRRWVAIIGSIFAVATAVYTGVLLSAVGGAIPLWSQPLLLFTSIPIVPILFLISALSTGVALTFDLAATIAVPDAHEAAEPMPLIHIGLVALELALISLLFISALGAGGAAAESANLVLFGPLSVIFWVGVVLIGLVFPFTVYIYTLGSKRHPWLLAVSSGTCVILAGLFLRYLIITAGVPAVL